MEPSNSRRHEPSANTCRFFQLPNPLIFDILSRLPIIDLLHCRCVCKMFFRFISDPEFARLNLSRSPLWILVDTGFPVPRLQSANVDADGANFQVSKLNFTSNVPTCDSFAISACNGLVCLVGYENEYSLDYSFYLCNPILGEFITIQPPDLHWSRNALWGLGYSSLTNQYKILQSYSKLESGNQYVMSADIYTIGTGTWRNIGNAPAGSPALPFDTFLNGALHWCKVFPKDGEFIHSFDFDAERFGTIPMPDSLRREGEEFEKHTMIGVLGGHLFITYSGNLIQFDIWVMNEYGVKESWAKKFVIEDFYPNLMVYMYSYVQSQPMVVLSNGEILILFNNEAILCYNRETKQVRQTEFFQFFFSAVAYNPCFVSLYNVAKGEQISRMQRTRVFDKICKEEFPGL